MIALTACSGDGSAPQSGAADKRKTAKGPVWRTDPGSIAALGDSITVGFDACTILSDCPQVSWATGTDPKVDSLARPAGQAPRPHSWNLARAGALISDLPDQITAAVDRRPELVTVLIGANDACRRDVRGDDPDGGLPRRLRAVHEAVAARPAAHPGVCRGGAGSVAAVVGRAQNPLGKQVWKLGICGSMLRDPDDLTQAAHDRRARVRGRVMAYNTALAEVCGKYPLCRFDKSVFDFRFTGRQLSNGTGSTPEPAARRSWRSWRSAPSPGPAVAPEGAPGSAR